LLVCAKKRTKPRESEIPCSENERGREEAAKERARELSSPQRFKFKEPHPPQPTPYTLQPVDA